MEIETFGPYRITGELGEGGMGRVYRARHETLQREVALKLLHPRILSNRGGSVRFQREMKLASRFRHPNLVGIFDGGEVDGTPFLAMELVDGESLDRVLRRSGAMDWQRAAALTAGIAAGLAYLHEHDVLHRDIKSDNVLVARDGAVRILDFGLAHQVDTTHVTEEGEMVGTLHYMAPELFEGLENTARSDLYALGCVLYELVCGKRRLDGKSAVHIIRTVIEEPAQLPPEVTARIPAPFAALVLALLERDPAQRPESARAVQLRLEGFASLATRRTSGAVNRRSLSSGPPVTTTAAPSSGARSFAGPGPARLAAAFLGLGLALAGVWLARAPRPAPAPSPVAAPAGLDAARVTALSAALEAYSLPPLLNQLAGLKEFDRGIADALVAEEGVSLFDKRDRATLLEKIVNKHPGALKAAALRELQRTSFWADLDALRGDAPAWTSPAVPDAAKLRLVRALDRLLDVELLILGQRDDQTLGITGLTAGFVHRRERLLDPAQPRPRVDEIRLFPDQTGWEVQGYNAWLPVMIWCTTSSEFAAIWPGKKISTIEDCKRTFLYRRVIQVPGPTDAQRSGEAVLRAEILLAASYAFEMRLRCGEVGDLPLTVVHPGTRPWFLAMDGADPQSRRPAPGTTQQMWWGEVELAIPARLIPREGAELTVNYRLPRGLKIEKISDVFQASYIRTLGLRYR